MMEIKGTKDGLLITIDETDWQLAQSNLLNRLCEQKEFLKGSRIILSLGELHLKAAELGALRDQISDLQLSLWTVLSQSAITKQSAQMLGIATELPTPSPTTNNNNLHGQPNEMNIINGEEAVLIRRTLRSGNKLQFTGHVIVYGDVNPGAEIIAGGDVFVWGKLKGTVHAGASGNENAVIAALELTPTQLRIAEHVAIHPKEHIPKGAEIAKLHDGQVLATPWSP